MRGTKRPLSCRFLHITLCHSVGSAYVSEGHPGNDCEGNEPQEHGDKECCGTEQRNGQGHPKGYNPNSYLGVELCQEPVEPLGDAPGPGHHSVPRLPTVLFPDASHPEGTHLSHTRLRHEREKELPTGLAHVLCGRKSHQSHIHQGLLPRIFNARGGPEKPRHLCTHQV